MVKSSLKVNRTRVNQPDSARKKKIDKEAHMHDASLLAICKPAATLSFFFWLLALITLGSFMFLFPSSLVSTSASEFSGSTEESIFPSLLRTESPVALASLTGPPSESSASISFPAGIYPARYPTLEGLLEPVDQNGSVFKIGSTIPVKFKLENHDGNEEQQQQQSNSSAPADYKAQIFTAKISDRVIGPEVRITNNKTSSDDAVGSISSIRGGTRESLLLDASENAQAVSAGTTENPTPGNYFLYDPLTDEFQFNLGTKNLTPGTWQIRIILDDGSSYTSNIVLVT